ncbi:MAG: hypothetical protein CMF42_03405 [Legionellales bacterium]|nr:hypothetical protein [Legionellales bacterium]
MRIGVYVGRFQPFHHGHYLTCLTALQTLDHLVICLGGCNSDRSLKNPWTFKERSLMIQSSFSKSELKRITIIPLYDSLYDNNAWKLRLEHQIASLFPRTTVYLLGYEKDQSSFYLSMFDDWAFMPMDNIQNINATDLRKNYFLHQALDENQCSKGASKFLAAFIKTPLFFEMRKKFQDIQASSMMTKKVINTIIQIQSYCLIEKHTVFSNMDQWGLPEWETDHPLQTKALHHAFSLFESQPHSKTISYLGHYDQTGQCMYENKTSYLYHVKLDNMLKIKAVDRCQWMDLSSFLEKKLVSDHISLIFCSQNR